MSYPPEIFKFSWESSLLESVEATVDCGEDKIIFSPLFVGTFSLHNGNIWAIS